MTNLNQGSIWDRINKDSICYRLKRWLFSEKTIVIENGNWQLMRNWKNGTVEYLESGSVKPSGTIKIPHNCWVETLYNDGSDSRYYSK